MTNRKTHQTGIEQNRAAFAFECAKSARDKKDYPQYVKKSPMLIKTNGTGATFAFMFDKGGDYYEIGKHLTEWLNNNAAVYLQGTPLRGFADLVEATVQMDSRKYRALTNEVLAFLAWLKRFASAMGEKGA